MYPYGADSNPPDAVKVREMAGTNDPAAPPPELGSGPVIEGVTSCVQELDAIVVLDVVFSVKQCWGRGIGAGFGSGIRE